MKHVELENVTDSWTKKIVCKSVQGNFNRNNNTEPDVDTEDVTEVSEDSIANPTYTIQRAFLLTDVSDEITYSDILDLYINKGKELYLIITYDGNKTVPSTQASYQNKIPVVLQSFSPNFSMNDSAAAKPTYTMTFVETLRP